MGTAEILEDIRSFIGSGGGDQGKGEFLLAPQDLTVLRQNVTAGMKYDKVIN